MAVVKRATKRLADAGLNAEVHRGLWGYTVRLPNVTRQQSRIYPTANEAVDAALMHGLRAPVVVEAK